MPNRAEMKALLAEIWGDSPHGFSKELGYSEVRGCFMNCWTVYIPQYGRYFVDGREVWMFRDRTELGDNFFRKGIPNENHN